MEEIIKKMGIVGLCISFGVFLIDGCSFEKLKTTESDTLYGWIDNNIFQAKCVSCHNSTNPPGGVNLSSYERAIATGKVIPNDPENSGLYQAVKRTGPKPMPISSSLSDDEVNAIYEWIKNGATETYKSIQTYETPTPSPTPTPTPNPNPSPSPSTATYSWIATNIVGQKCWRCHGEGTFIELHTYELVMKYVVPNKPEQSSFYTRPKNGGDIMPPVTMTAEEENAIVEWIKKGAPKD